MIELIDLLEELNKIVVSKKNEKIKNIIDANSPENRKNKQIPATKKTFNKRNQFEILNHLEEKIAKDFPNLISEQIKPYSSNIKRHGVLKKYESANISFYSSFVTILYNDFIDDESFKKTHDITQRGIQLLMIGDLIKDASSIIQHVVDNTQNKKLSHTIFDKFGWKKKELLKSLNNFECDKTIIGLFSYIYDVNIFIFHISNDKIFAVYHENHYNKYKTTLMFSYYDNIYEPLSYDNSFKWNIKPNTQNLLLKFATIEYKSIGVIDINITNNTSDKTFKHASTEELYT